MTSIQSRIDDGAENISRETKRVTSKFPKVVKRFLALDDRKPNPSTPIRLLTIFIATMGGLLASQAVVLYAPLYQHHWHFNKLVPSFGATCILIYNAVASPLAQPRNLLFGQLISGIIGIGMMKLFMENEANEKYLWLSASLSVSISSVLMDITGTIHPPAGATALLPSLDAEFRELGWKLLPDLLILDCLFFGIALLCNNIFRKYPTVWFFPPKPKQDVKPGATIVLSSESIQTPEELNLDEYEVVVLERLQDKLKGLV